MPFDIDDQIYVEHTDSDSLLEGLDKKLEAAGFELRQPGCSACLAMNDDKIPEGKYSVSTSNRNFEGRQGPGARTLLASPLTAAAAAVKAALIFYFQSFQFQFLIDHKVYILPHQFHRVMHYVLMKLHDNNQDIL